MLHPSIALIQQSTQQARRRTVRFGVGTPAVSQAAAIFQPDDVGQIAARINFSLICLYCGQDLCGEHINLVEYQGGRTLIFHSQNGHVLTYREAILQRVECGSPVAATVYTRRRGR